MQSLSRLFSFKLSRRDFWLAAFCGAFFAIIVAMYGKADVVKFNDIAHIAFPARENNLASSYYTPTLEWYYRPAYYLYQRQLNLTDTAIKKILQREQWLDLSATPAIPKLRATKKLFPTRGNSPYTTISAEINHGFVSSGWLRIISGGCVGSITVNNKEVRETHKSKARALCSRHGYEINLQPYYKHGLNQVSVNLVNAKNPRLVPIFSPLILVMQFIYISIAALSVLMLLWQRLTAPQQQILRRYGSIGSISLPVVLTLFCFQAIIQGRWTWLPSTDYLATHLPQLSAQFLPLPFLFFLWLRIVEGKSLIATKYSPLACIISVICLTVTQEFIKSPTLIQCLFAISIVTGLFVLLPFSECVKRAKEHRLATLVAFVAATAPSNFYWLTEILWRQMCSWTTFCVYHILHVFTDQVHLGKGDWEDTSFIIKSPYLIMKVYPGCSGLEGIFLFSFMLSVYFLYDWDYFKNRKIIRLYLIGLIYMFAVNCLRIVTYFAVGYWANNPDAWLWVQEFKGTPVVLFHTYIGWVYYIIAFVLYCIVLL